MGVGATNEADGGTNGNRSGIPRHQKVTSILWVEDNLADRRLIQEAFGETDDAEALYFVQDGAEALDFLRRTGEMDGLPRLIVIDLNLPKKNGGELLRELKNDPSLKRIPVVIFTSSVADADRERCYDLSASSYVIKPSDLDRYFTVIQSIRHFWFRVVAPVDGWPDEG